MSIIAELSRKIPPPFFAEILKPFPRPTLAEKLGVSTIYVTHVLTGYKKPSRELKQKFIDLAEQVEAELKMQEDKYKC